MKLLSKLIVTLLVIAAAFAGASTYWSEIQRLWEVPALISLLMIGFLLGAFLDRKTHSRTIKFGQRQVVWPILAVAGMIAAYWLGVHITPNAARMAPFSSLSS